MIALAMACVWMASAYVMLALAVLIAAEIYAMQLQLGLNVSSNAVQMTAMAKVSAWMGIALAGRHSLGVTAQSQSLATMAAMTLARQMPPPPDASSV